MNDEVIVLFPSGQDAGVPAVTWRQVREDEDSVTYEATFAKAFQAPVAVSTPGPGANVVELSPDTTPSPNNVDFDEFPDLPDAS